MEKARERWRKPREGGVHGAKVANMAWVGQTNPYLGSLLDDCKSATLSPRNKCTGCFAPSMVPVDLDDTSGSSISGRINFIGLKKNRMHLKDET